MTPKLRPIIILSLIFLCLAAWQYQRWNQLRLVFCDVGQGDATLLTQRNTQLLVDAGPNFAVLSCLSHELPWWDRTLEIAVATHPDADHIGGFTAVFDRYQINNLVMTTDFKTTKTFSDFEQAVQAALTTKHLRVEQNPFSGQQLGFSSRVSATIILNPLITRENGKKSSRAESLLSAQTSVGNDNGIEVNDRSIMLFMHLEEVGVILMADASQTTEQALLDRHMTEETDVLKAGHHGSKSSSSLPFLQQVRPELTVISSGKGNRYGHPHPDVLLRLESIGSRVLRTDEKGAIAIIIDGDHFRLRQPIISSIRDSFGFSLLNQRSKDSDTHKNFLQQEKHLHTN